MKKKILALAGVLALVAALVMPTAILAANIEITGTVVKAIELTPPAGFAMPNLDPSAAQPITSAVQTATVKANHTGWTLTVVEAGVSPDGKMAPTVGDPLASAMTVKGGDQTPYASLASEVSLEDGGDSAAGTTNIDDIYFQQAVSWDDAVGTYSITVTFTATAGA